MSSGAIKSRIRIDIAGEYIWRDGERLPVPPKAFSVLRCLMSRPGEVVTKRELMAAAWPDAFVSDVVLNVAIRRLREIFRDDPKSARFIETAHRRGFRWIGDLHAEHPNARPELTRRNTAESGPSIECVGRAAMMATLDACYDRAAGGHRQVVFVTGEPGIGKTALVDEFVKVLAAKLSVVPSAAGSRLQPNNGKTDDPSDLLVAHGQCTESFTAGELYRPVVEAIESLLRNDDGALRAVFSKHAPTWMLQMPELSTAEELEALRRTVSGSSGDRMPRELERAIAAASTQRTIVLVLEDLHWSDPATVGLLWALAARREAAHLLIIGTYRPADAIADQHPIVRMKQELTSKKQCVEIALDGLDCEAVETYLGLRYVGNQLPADFAARLQRQTSGNPLFLLNALADFEQRGWLQQRDGKWTCTVDLDTLAAAVPDGTREIISFRLDQLPRQTQELLEAASAAGEMFPTQVLAAAIECSCDDVEEICASLRRTALFLQDGDDVQWPDGSRGRHHSFRHALYRQVLDARVPPARRRLLHERVAKRLETGYRERSAEIAGLLSFHWEHAGDLVRAVDYIDQLVPQAYARRATHEAEAWTAHAVALLKRLPPSAERQQRLLRTTIAYGMALSASRGGTSAEAERIFTEARELGQSIPTSAAHVMSLATMSMGALMNGRLQDSRLLGEELLALAGPDAPPHTAICAHLSVGSAQLYIGEVAAAVDHLQSGVGLVEQAPAALAEVGEGPGVALRTGLGIALILAGHGEPGWAHVMAGVDLAKTMEAPWFHNFALAAASVSAIFRRDLAAVRFWSTELLTYCEAHGLAHWPGMQRIHLAWADVVESRDPAHIDALARAVDAFRPNSGLVPPRMCGLLAEGYLCVARFDDASRALDEGFDSRSEERLYQSDLWRLRAAVVLARAEKGKLASHAQRADAEQFLLRALEIAASQRAHLFHLRAAVDLCRLWRSMGKLPEARRQLGEAIAAFPGGPLEVDLRAANELLVEIRD